MRVGVEQAVLQHLLQHEIAAAPGDERRVEAGWLAPDVDRLAAVHEFHREDAAGGSIPVDLGEADRRIARVVPGEAVYRAPFPREVQLAPDRPGEL